MQIYHSWRYFVNSGRGLCLVDYDEGVAATKHVSRRNLDLDQSNAWLQAVIYPNVLRQFGERHTQVQLLALMFLALYNDRPIEGLDLLTFFAELHTLGNRLLEDDNPMQSKGWVAGKRRSEESIPLDVIHLIDTLWGKLPLNDSETTSTVSL